MKKPFLIIILDGWGAAPNGSANAISRAPTPVLDRLFAEYPHTTLSASGMDVGLPEGQMGNSEVGHTNIGAGRVVFQDLPRITNDIQTEAFYENSAFNAAIDNCLQKGTALHLMGLMSDGGVHSHNTHVWAFLELCKRRGLDRVYLHCFLDGRDVPPKSGRGFVAEAVAKCREITGQVATVMGRYYAMDRDNRWERVEKAYRQLISSDADIVPDAADAVQKSYDAGVTDEFMEPVSCVSGAGVKEGDSIIFFNFRPDRAREITRVFTDPEFDGFTRGYFPVHYVCTTEYSADMPNVSVAYPPRVLTNIFGEYISGLGLTQLRIAETEKYAHVTFFFNGGEEQTFPGEDRVLIPSPKVPTYDHKPEMSAYEVTDAVVERILSGKYDVIVLNFANCDMVGHTGVMEAAEKAVAAVDGCVGRVLEAVLKMGGRAIVTSDHGNADCMLEADGVSPFTAHTTNPVPFILVGADAKLRNDGKLCDICPTVLDLMGLVQPEEMSGKSLII
jgi:2,3-bisphosphoglycerate-independent phosphoglycerate mutase